MGAVSVAIHGVIVVVMEIPSVDVVHIAVSIVVLLVSGNLSGVFPKVALQVLVVVVDSRVDDCNNNFGTALGPFPCLGGLDFFEGILLRPIGIVR